MNLCPGVKTRRQALVAFRTIRGLARGSRRNGAAGSDLGRIETMPNATKATPVAKVTDPEDHWPDVRAFFWTIAS